MTAFGHWRMTAGMADIGREADDQSSDDLIDTPNL